MIKKGLGLLTLLVMLFLSLGAQELRVSITNVRNDGGVIRLAFFLDNDTFMNETPIIYKTVSKENLQNGNLYVKFSDIPPDTYGIALLDDENENDEMNYNWLGVPKEGFGFSNLYHTGLSKPHFDDFSFKFYDDKTINIKVRYIY